MELPIAKESYEPSADTLLRAVKRADVILSRVMAEETQLERATAFTNADRPGVRAANHAMDLTLGPQGPPDADAALAEVLAHFEAAGVPCHTLQCVEAAWPAALAEAVRRRGYQPREKRLFLLRDYRPPERHNDELQVIPARAAYAQLAPFYQQMAQREHGADQALAQQVAAAMIDRLDESRLEMFLARLQGQPVAVAGVLTLGNMGVISPAYTRPECRGRGIAGALMAHVLEHCQRALFEQVLLVRSAHCDSLPFYQEMGFSPVASFQKYALASR